MVIALKAEVNKLVYNKLVIFLGNISKYFLVDNMKKIGLYGHIHDFSVGYDSLDVDDILEIHKYLMKNHDIR